MTIGDPFRPSERRRPGRSPLLIGAYCAIGISLLLLLLGSGRLWVVGTAVMAVVLGLAEIVIQVRRR